MSQSPVARSDATLRERLRNGRFVVTAELAPPLSCNPQDLLALAAPLRGIADAINITDGAGARTSLSALAAATLLVQAGFEPVLQLTCRDRNRIALQSDLLSAAASGVRNLLVLRGDDPSAGDQPDAKPVFDLDPRGLLATARELRDAGTLPGGRKVSGRADFFLGGADNPIDPPPDWVPAGLKAKIDAGAQFVQTQFCMDVGVLRRYVARLAEHGLDKRVSLLIGIAPLRSAKSARWMKDKLNANVIPDALIARMDVAKDPVAEGARIAVELIGEIARVPGIAGVHVMAPMNDAVVPGVLTAARQDLRRLAPA
jgi:methylenetetrahydrofolate reductase (NADPH)